MYLAALWYKSTYIIDDGSAFEIYAPLGLKTEFVGEAQTDCVARDRVLRGEVQLVFISPESIIGKEVYRKMLLSSQYKEKLVALAVDEAHCVKTWGDQFRKSFSMIGELRSLVPTPVKILAVTATATTETFHVVTQRLSMDNPTIIALPPHRDNIMDRVDPSIDVNNLTDLLRDEFQTKRASFPKTILFVRTYEDC